MDNKMTGSVEKCFFIFESSLRNVYMRLKISLCTVFMFFMIYSCTISRSVEMEIKEPIEKRKIGSVIIRDEDNQTVYSIELRNAIRNSNYSFDIHGNDKNNIGSSIQKITNIVTDNNGNGESSGILTYRNIESIRYDDIIDENHIIVINDEIHEWYIKMKK